MAIIWDELLKAGTPYFVQNRLKKTDQTSEADET